MCRGSIKLPPTLMILIGLAVFLTLAQSALGLQFYLWKEECFSQKIEEEGDTVRVSFVVVRRKSKIHSSTSGIDLVVKGPNGEQVHDDRDKKSEHFEFVARKKGLYKFCFSNKAGFSEMIDFNVVINHQEHLEPLKNNQLMGVHEKITELDSYLRAVDFKLRWLISDQFRLEEINHATNFWAITKAGVESVALVGCSIFQVYLLKRLFKRKLGEFN